MRLIDKFGRPITDLRIAITDRCNYKCVYCRTGNDGALYADLPFADYLRMARIFASIGIKKIRITGGEPLLRGGVVAPPTEDVSGTARAARLEHEPAFRAQARPLALQAGDDLGDVRYFRPAQAEYVRRARGLLIGRAAIVLRNADLGSQQQGGRDGRRRQSRRGEDASRKCTQLEPRHDNHDRPPPRCPIPCQPLYRDSRRRDGRRRHRDE